MHSLYFVSGCCVWCACLHVDCFTTEHKCQHTWINKALLVNRAPVKHTPHRRTVEIPSWLSDDRVNTIPVWINMRAERGRRRQNCGGIGITEDGYQGSSTMMAYMRHRRIPMVCIYDTTTMLHVTTLTHERRARVTHTKKKRKNEFV